MDDVERELVAAAQAVFAAIEARDRAALLRLTSEEFVVRVPGSPDVDREGFLAAVAGIPGEILSVGGEHLAARRLGPGHGIVSGFQLARVRIDGAEVLDRAPFADVFERHDGAWRMTLAFNVAPVEG